MEPIQQFPEASKSTYLSIPIEKVMPSRHQARKNFDEESIKALAESMKQEGLIQAITVRKVGNDYELIGGERRFRAAKLLGWTEIEVKVIQTVSEGEAAAKGLVENLQRENLNPIEEAEGFAELKQLDSYWNQERIAEAVGKSPDYVSRSLALLDLPLDIVEKLRQRNLSREHGIELIRLNNAKEQKRLAKKVGKRALSVLQTRQIIDKKLGKTSSELRTQSSEKGISEPRAQSSELISDPLAQVWSTLQKDMNPASGVLWEARYGRHEVSPGQKAEGWFFFTTALGSATPQANLAGWFTQMGKALSGSQGHEAPPTPIQARVRVPQTPEEQKELEDLAIKGGPKAVYEWIYGYGSRIAQLAPESWERVGAAPLDGLNRVLGRAREMLS